MHISDFKYFVLAVDTYQYHCLSKSIWERKSYKNRRSGASSYDGEYFGRMYLLQMERPKDSEVNDMKLLMYITDFTVPAILLLVVAYGILEKVKVYDEFVIGAEKGFFTVIKILPTLVGLMIGVGVLRASGFLELLASILGNITDRIGFPSQLVPVAIVRMFSSSAATGLVIDLFKEYGTDSRIGLIASVMMSCTETIFYTMSVYFMVAKVKKTRHTLTGALLATLAGIVASVWIVAYI